MATSTSYAVRVSVMGESSACCRMAAPRATSHTLVSRSRPKGSPLASSVFASSSRLMISLYEGMSTRPVRFIVLSMVRRGLPFCTTMFIGSTIVGQTRGKLSPEVTKRSLMSRWFLSA